MDTNVLVSAMLFRRSAPREALLKAFREGDVLSSSATRAELREVVSRKKFNRYVPYDLRMAELEVILDQMKDVEAVSCNSECRDAKDEKFFDLAFGAGASLILSGDVHLLEMNPFRGIPVLSPVEYLAQTHQL